MKENSRIKLFQNGVNRKTLYTETRSVLNAKGKYAKTLDHDNLYVIKDLLLYRDAEDFDVDILGSSSIGTTIKLKDLPKYDFLNYFRIVIVKKEYIYKAIYWF